MTKIIASATCGITAVRISETAANTSDSPNSRRRDRSRATRGPNAMPEPSPTNTAPNSTP